MTERGGKDRLMIEFMVLRDLVNRISLYNTS